MLVDSRSVLNAPRGGKRHRRCEKYIKNFFHLPKVPRCSVNAKRQSNSVQIVAWLWARTPADTPHMRNGLCFLAPLPLGTHRGASGLKTCAAFDLYRRAPFKEGKKWRAEYDRPIKKWRWQPWPGAGG